MSGARAPGRGGSPRSGTAGSPGAARAHWAARAQSRDRREPSAGRLRPVAEEQAGIWAGRYIRDVNLVSRNSSLAQDEAVGGPGVEEPLPRAVGTYHRPGPRAKRPLGSSRNIIANLVAVR